MDPNKLNSPVFFFKLVLGVFLFAFVLGLPSGITAWFDGLPWTSGAETLTLSVVVPFLLILGWRFLSLRLPITILTALLILKLILFLASPSGGWLVRVMTPSVSQGQSSVGAKWVKTYATSWNKNASGILQKPWTEKLDFPLDWALFSLNCSTCFDALSLTIEVDGALLMPEGKKFALIARGVEEGTLSAVNKDGESFNLLPAKSFEDAARQKYQLPQAKEWKISGKLKYAGVDWSLVPVMVNPDGKISSGLDRGTLWQNKEGLAGSLDYIGLFKILSLILDGGIILFLLAWATWIARLLVERKILNWPLAICGLMLTCLPIATASILGELFKILRLSNPGNVNHLGILSVVAGTSFLTWTWWKKDFRSFHADRIVQSVFLFFGPGILFFFSKKWWSSLGQWKNWGTGDDWTSYQMYAHKIVVDGEWLQGGENIFVMQPLYRYFVGVYHWLFGQSAFVQNIADVWCILGATVLLASWVHKTSIVSFNCICCQPYLPDAYFSWWISLSNWKRIGRAPRHDIHGSGWMATVWHPRGKFFENYRGWYLWRYRLLAPSGSPHCNNDARIFYYRTHTRNNERSLEGLLAANMHSLEERVLICRNYSFWAISNVFSQLVGRGSVRADFSRPSKLHRTGYDSFLS